MLSRLLCCFLLCALPLASQETTSLVLRGTVVTPHVVIEDGFIAISGEKITSVGEFAQHPESKNIIETHGIIAPGLIDLHDHITWNVFPRWKPGQLFPNRYAWQALQSYNVALTAPHTKLVEDHLECEMELYGEVKAIVHGATSIVGSQDDACVEGMARNLDTYSGFYAKDVLHQEKLKYEVFPFQSQDAAETIARLKDGRLTSYIAHVAEGAPNDASAAREFVMFKQQGFLVKGTSIVHGVALGRAQFKDMAAAQVGFIWSPRSNVELYGATTDIAAAMDEGVKVALAPDWSPSGSDGVLDEMKYAATWSVGVLDPKTGKPLLSAEELVKMTTENAAELAAVPDKIGRLAPGMYADLIIVRPVRADAYESLVHANASDVNLAMIGGAAVYGSPEMMQKMAPKSRVESISICGKPKLLSMSTYLYGKGANDVWAATTSKLSDDLEQWGSSLAPLAECAGK